LEEISHNYVQMYVTVFIVQYVCGIIMFIVLGDVLYDSSSYCLCPTCHHLFSDCQLCDMSNWLDVSLFVSNLVRAPTVVCVLAVWLIGNLLLVN